MIIDNFAVVIISPPGTVFIIYISEYIGIEIYIQHAYLMKVNGFLLSFLNGKCHIALLLLRYINSYCTQHQ